MKNLVFSGLLFIAFLTGVLFMMVMPTIRIQTLQDEYKISFRLPRLPLASEKSSDVGRGQVPVSAVKAKGNGKEAKDQPIAGLIGQADPDWRLENGIVYQQILDVSAPEYGW